MTPPPAPPRTHGPPKDTDARLLAEDPWPPARGLHPLAPPPPRVEVVDVVIVGAIVEVVNVVIVGAIVAACLMGAALVML